MYSQWTCIIAIYSLVRGVGVGFFLEARGRKTLEVEGTGLDTGETCDLFALGVDGEGDGVDCEGDLFERPEVMNDEQSEIIESN